jgi:hypothetical protein
VSAFLRNILDVQPREITARFETMDIEHKHPIYAAIERCEIRVFKQMLTEAFDNAYPRNDRIERYIRDIQTVTFDASTQHLLTLRTSLIGVVTKLHQLTDTPEYTNQRKYGMDEILRHFMRLIEQITETNVKFTVLMAITQAGTTGIIDARRLEQILLVADSKLRDSHSRSYPPVAQSIPVHVAQPTPSRREPKPICLACDARWGYKWKHLPDQCFLSKEEKQAWRERTDRKWIENNPGKELPPFNQPWDKRKRQATSSASDALPAKKSSKERTI